jgi:ubiquitin-protein ligase
MATAIRRIKKEFDDINKDGGSEYSATMPIPDNMHQWHVIITGPPDSVYEGIKYKLKVEFPENYPFKAPKIHFITPIYHANVMLTTGEICLDILKDNWTPALSLPKVLLSLQLLMAAPNGESALNFEASRLLTDDIAAMKAKVAAMAAENPVN